MPLTEKREGGQKIPPPIRDTCRARLIAGNKKFAECLAEDPRHCRFALYFGCGCMCFHPLRSQIAARTSPGTEPEPASPIIATIIPPPSPNIRPTA